MSESNKTKVREGSVRVAKKTGKAIAKGGVAVQELLDEWLCVGVAESVLSE